MKVLVFRAAGDYARFRCPYTTTSALTYTLMHPIAVKGLVGAIMGIDYSELYEYTKNMKVAVEVLKPVRKDTQSFNLVPQTHGNGAANFQSRVEFLRDVEYRFYITDEDEKLQNIKEVLLSRGYTFTPYLGASEHIAKLTFEELLEAETLSVEGVSLVNTVLPKANILIEKNEEIEICLDRIPVKNEKNREYIKYEKVAFVENGSLVSRTTDLYKVGNKNVYFF